jgi:hypothetical protein
MEASRETRPSWYCCDVCRVPHTAEKPLVQVYLVANTRLSWRIHPECMKALQDSLHEGTALSTL